MALKSYKPVTPGQRQLVLVARTGLHKGKPVKALTEGKSSTGARNNSTLIPVSQQFHPRALRCPSTRARSIRSEPETRSRALWRRAFYGEPEVHFAG